MPEGDTIFRTAERLQAALAGRVVSEFRSVLPQLERVDEDHRIAGRTIDRVWAAGKHLLIDFSGGIVLRTHLRMHGSWHVYRPGEKWRRRSADWRIMISTADIVAVGFSIPVAEMGPRESLLRGTAIQRLGPDLLAPDPDVSLAVERLATNEREEIANALLDQSVVAGIGNVFKSEVLFVAGVHPFDRVGELTSETLHRIVEIAIRLMRFNVAPGSPAGRSTTGRLNPREKLWVYGRRGRPCRRCGSPVRSRRQGRDARTTWWCEQCQPRRGVFAASPRL